MPMHSHDVSNQAELAEVDSQPALPEESATISDTIDVTMPIPTSDPKISEEDCGHAARHSLNQPANQLCPIPMQPAEPDLYMSFRR